jgi:ethanolamine utilization protein EutN
VKIGRVTGTVVSTGKLESMEGIKLLLVQPLDDKMQNSGNPLVACDTVQAGTGDLVIYEGGREAALALDNWYNPSDAAVIGIIDQLDQVEK